MTDGEIELRFVLQIYDDAMQKAFDGREFDNPCVPGSTAAMAWEIGKAEGAKKRTAGLPHSIATVTDNDGTPPPSSPSELDLVAQGRSEAVAIILQLDPEVGLDDCIGYEPAGDTGEYSSFWIEEKLHSLFKTDDRAWSLVQKAEGEYWRNLGLRDEAEFIHRNAVAKYGDLEALRKDAERYRWLRQRNAEPYDDKPYEMAVVFDNEEGGDWVGSDLDSAIDAAIAAEREG